MQLSFDYKITTLLVLQHVQLGDMQEFICCLYKFGKWKLQKIEVVGIQC